MGKAVRTFVSWAAASLLLGLAGSGKAETFANNDFALELTPGAVFGSARQMGLGGAYTAVAEGVGALSSNSAAAAVRPPGSTGTWHWDVSYASYFLQKIDLPDLAESAVEQAGKDAAQAGLLVQHRRWGVGYLTMPKTLRVDSQGTSYRYGTAMDILAVGAAFRDRELTVGLGPRVARAFVQESSDGSPDIAELRERGWALGAHWHPNRGRWRYGLNLAGRVSAEQPLAPSPAVTRVSGLIIPSRVVMPAQLSLGAAHARRLTARRLPFLFAADLTLTERSDNAYSVESLLRQEPVRAGERPTVGLRAGLEAEAAPRRLRLRAGGYTEPSRVEGVSSRGHLTLGGELRLFDFVFLGRHSLSLQYAADRARGYFNQVLSLGFWAAASPDRP